MPVGTVYIHVQMEATRRWEKVMEGDRTRWKHMESYGSLWKMQEQSIGKLVSEGARRPRVTDRNGRRNEIGR